MIPVALTANKTGRINYKLRTAGITLNLQGALQWAETHDQRQRIFLLPLFFLIVWETYTRAKETYKLLYFTIF